jgi:hypothetical protein
MTDVGIDGQRLGSPLSFPENMKRWTAKFLLLVLLAGMCAPMAAALSMPADHCVRKPVAAPAQSMAGCHHHNHATGAQPSNPRLTVQSRQCCEGHECCRSMVRSHSARVAPRTLFQQIDRTEDSVSPQQASLIYSEPAAYHSVRGPPAL